jgi:hypothetical protein
MLIKTNYIRMKYYLFSPKLKMWYIESYKEKNKNIKKIDHSYAVYPKRFYKNIDYNLQKSYDFCFIGSLYIDKQTFLNRKWILPFIKNYFNKNSYLQFTDKKTKNVFKKELGVFDYTHKKEGLVPKEVSIDNRNFFDKEYFDNLTKSKFCLCPGGDKKYSMRFYECLMCKCIPIVENKEETYRSKDESKLGYKYYLSNSKEFIYKPEWAEYNYKLFLKYHTLEYVLK